MWANIAATSGGTLNVKTRDQVAAKMTPQQIAEAQHMGSKSVKSGVKKCGDYKRKFMFTYENGLEVSSLFICRRSLKFGRTLYFFHLLNSVSV